MVISFENIVTDIQAHKQCLVSYFSDWNFLGYYEYSVPSHYDSYLYCIGW